MRRDRVAKPLEPDAMRCPICKSTEVRPIDHSYHYTECGLDYVFLTGMPYMHCKECGDDVVAIPRQNQLLRLIATQIIISKHSLMPQEIRFLRLLVGWSQEELAQVLRRARVTVTRWETGKQGLPVEIDVLLRFVWLHEYARQVREDSSQAFPRGRVAKLDEIIATLNAEIVMFQETTQPRMDIDVSTMTVVAA